MITGSIVALVTPMVPVTLDVDWEALERLVEWHIDQGTHALVAVGTTGESATLSVEEHSRVIKFMVDISQARIPVIAGTGANSTSEAIELTMESKQMGADFSLLVTPYYNKPNQKGLIQHYTKVANEVDLPQILYNVPSRTACDLKPSSVKILSEHKNIIGIKEAVGDPKRIDDLIQISSNNEDFLLYSGDDPSFLSMLKKGGDGVISVAANVVPEYISDICSSALEEKFDIAEELDNKLSTLYELLFIESNPIPVKWMLYKMELIQKSIRLPLIELDKKYHENILSEMLKLNLL